jgi:hypothetical protein
MLNGSYKFGYKNIEHDILENVWKIRRESMHKLKQDHLPNAGGDRNP